MYHTGLDPMTKKPVYVAKGLRDRTMQRALLQFFKPENYFEVRRALEQAGRRDLIGGGCDCLIPAHAPKVALERRRKKSEKDLKRRASELAAGKPNATKTKSDRSAEKTGSGYRPHRKTAKRRTRK
jgi:hypothetical protein